MAKKHNPDNPDNETPLMRQYNTIKTKYPGAILLFRVGDFYETFGTDAIKTAEILGIVLTKRANGSHFYRVSRIPSSFLRYLFTETSSCRSKSCYL